jgi:hypothetical protein
MGYFISFCISVWRFEPFYRNNPEWTDYFLNAVLAIMWPLFAPFIILGTFVSFIKNQLEGWLNDIP